MMESMNNELKLQGKIAKCIYNFKATMNDELNIKIDDLIVITQCSEDETWFEGTLNGVTGWFPSNYVQILEHTVAKPKETETNSNQLINSEKENPKINDVDDDEIIRIKYLNELKQIEQSFLDEMNKFVKITIQPLQTHPEIFPTDLAQQIYSSVDELIRCHQMFFKQLKEIPDDADAKIGNLLVKVAPHFKSVYEMYSRNHPKFINSVNKKKEQLNIFFEKSISKMSSSILPLTSNMTVAIYISKFLSAPFKQLEIYVKLLKEIQRYTQDSHIDRGDVQRCIEFYSDLVINVQEIKKKKEYELDIISSKINNIEEDLFKNGEPLFLSSGLIINETGEIKDRILMLFNNYLVVLAQSTNSDEFDFDYTIQLTNNNPNSYSQIKKVSNLESVNSYYGANLVGSGLVNKYSFELINIVISYKLNYPSNSQDLNRVLVLCSSLYDLKMWIDLISIELNKTRLLTSSLNKSTKEKDLSNSFNNTQNSYTSPIVSKTNTTNQSKYRKIFCARPHPPLIPHFQLPNDLPQTTSIDGSVTLKRFMYKKPKLAEPFGKYHGADDDLKLLNVIDSFCKTKVRQSVSINNNNTNQEITNFSLNKSNSIRANDFFNDSITKVSTLNEKNLQKYVNKLADEKCRLEFNITSITNELNEFKKANKELKEVISNLQKHLENEKQNRRKLEYFIRKHVKINQMANNEKPNNIMMMNIEHESSI